MNGFLAINSESILQRNSILVNNRFVALNCEAFTQFIAESKCIHFLGRENA